jgi:hypothetical protein
VRELICSSRTLKVCEISAEAGLSYGMCQAILIEDFNLRRFCMEFVLHVFTIKQKEHHLSVASSLLQEAEEDQNCMEEIITGEETWVYGYDLET